MIRLVLLLVITIPMLTISHFLQSAERTPEVLLTPTAMFTVTPAAKNTEPIGHVGGYAWSVFTYTTDNRTYAYVGVDTTLAIYDVTTPTNPIRVGTIHFSNRVQDVEINRRYAYVAVGKGGLRIFDLADPSAPVEIGLYRPEPTLGVSDRVETITIKGNYVYLGAIWNEFWILNISNPALPRKIGSYDFSDADNEAQLYNIRDVSVSGDFAYIVGGYAYSNTGLRILDISDATAPRLVGIYDTPRTATRIIIKDDYAYLLVPENYAKAEDDDNSTLHVVDISQPDSPTQVGSYDAPTFVWEVKQRGDFLYLADDTNGLRIVDISDPLTPVEVGYFDPPESILAIAVEQNFAYLGGEYGLRIVDVTNPTIPKELGHYLTPGLVKAVAVVDKTTAYVAAGRQGLAVLDISTPTLPEVVTFYNLPGYTLDVTVAGQYAYVATELNGLYIFDTTTPEAPVQVGVYNPPGEVRTAVIHETYAYVMGDGSLRIVDISDAAQPVEISQYNPPGWVEQVKIIDQIAYIIAKTGGLRLVDVSNPANPVEISVYEAPGETKDVTVISEGELRYAYVNWIDCVSPIYCVPGLHLVDISDLSTPKEIEEFYQQERSSPRILVANDPAQAYLLGEDELYQVDVSEPITPTTTGLDQKKYVSDFNLFGGYIYQAKESDGLSISQPEWISTLFPADSPQPRVISQSTAVTTSITLTPSLTLTSTISNNTAYSISPFTPQEILDLIEAKKFGALDIIWRELDIEPALLGDYVSVKKFDIKDELDQGPDVIIRISPAYYYTNYLLFTQTENQWQLLTYLTDVYSRFDEFEHQIITDNEDIWFVLRRQSGSGTGYSLSQEDWYYLADHSLRLVLSYPVSGYNAQYGPLQVSHDGGLLKHQRNGELFTVETQIQCSFSSGYFRDDDDEELEEIPLFEASQNIRYTWQPALNQFTIDSPQSVSTEEEVFRNTCTIAPASFLANNFEALMEFTTTQDELKQRWLKRFLEEAESEVRQSAEAKALLEALD